ncbi:MAG: M28 family peptidase [Candidatus Aureabacteria bacterium]|nr:M28 family peptidase [Candidatus Auribacterota bacterium]
MQGEKCIGILKRYASISSEGGAFPSLLTGIGWSDHSSFWQMNYPALMVTDTAFYRYPYYHTFEDTLDKLDYASMAEVVKGLVQMIREID